MSDRGLHTISEDLAETWLEDWIGVGLDEIDAYLGKHAAFEDYVSTRDPAQAS
jgi:hypothetical protein